MRTPGFDGDAPCRAERRRARSRRWTATPIPGNANTLLEPAELIRISIDLLGAGATIGANQVFTLEIKPPTGSYMVIQRMTPPAFQSVNNLN